MSIAKHMIAVRTMSEQNLNKITVYKRDKWVSGSFFKQFVFAIDLSNGQILPVWRLVKPEWISKDNNKEHVVGQIDRNDVGKLKGYLLKDIAVMYSSKSGKKKVSVNYYIVSLENQLEGLKPKKEKVGETWFDVLTIDDKKVKVGKDKVEIERYTT